VTQFIPLTERLLNDAGGWQAMKAARGLQAAGRVSESAYEPPVLRGLVREGNTQYRAGLRIGSKTDIENLCGCRDSRQRGLICAHSLAVGLEVLRPTPAAPAAVPMVEASASRVPAPEPRDVIATSNCGARFGIQEGIPIQLQFLLAPSFAEAWLRGAVNIGVEAVMSNGPRPLSALAKGAQFSCSSGDVSVISAILKMTGGERPASLSLRPSQAEGLLSQLIGNPRVSLGRGKAVRIGERTGRLPLSADRQPDGSLRLKVEVPNGATVRVGWTSVWLWDAANLRLERAINLLPAAYLELFRQPSVIIPSSGVEGFLRKELPALVQWFEIAEMPDVAVPTGRSGSTEIKFHLKLEGSLNYLAAELEARTAERRVTITSQGYRPSQPAESAALARLRGVGFDGPNARGEWVLRGEPAVLAFFAQGLPSMEKDWEVSVGTRFEHVTKDLERVQPRFEVRGSGQNWFEVSFDLATDSGERLSASDVRRLLASGQRKVRLRNNRTAILAPELLDEFEEILKDTDPKQAQPGTYRFDQRDAAYLKGFTDRVGGHLDVAGAGQQQWNSALPFLRLIPAPDLGPLGNQLRSYQQDGVNWIYTLSENGLHGILADEMGLGKTVQTLAFLRLLRGPKLVVCPASLTLNWLRETQRFAPDLNPVLVSELSPSGLPGASAKEPLLITSYGLLRRDVSILQDIGLAAVVLDEAQHIKNPDSQTAKAAHQLRAPTRLALTGTPIENGVRDIWSVMQFLMPGYLGNRDRFKERFEGPIHQRPGGPEHRRLVERLRPFILRRTKSQVAKELPEKIIQVSECELTESQKKLYAELLRAAQSSIADASGPGADGKAKIAAFTALLRLRQVCCDPRLLLPEDNEKEPESAKLEQLMELVSDGIEDGHQILVFSQFARMLRLISRALEPAGIPFCYLDGSTRNRQAEVDRFQAGAAPVFLISLKAGGVGLNLTRADMVVLYDPWWNPAVEAQAMDRAHRIGQKRAVTVYKLIAKGTVEEKILALQARKRELSEQLVESEQPLMEGLDLKELSELLD
jgi:superfamily II DNA or RNA helicase